MKTTLASSIQPISSNPASSPSQSNGLVVILPSAHEISATVSESAKGTVTQLHLNKVHIVDYCILDGTALALELSAIGTQFEGVTEHNPKTNIFELSSNDQTGTPKAISIADMWASIYALFTLHCDEEHIPTRFNSIPNEKELTHYLLISESGLGRRAPRTRSPGFTTDVIFLSRATFWQGAGTTSYHSRGWVLTLAPTFPSLPAFTRLDVVIASHPLRPPKPYPGEILYRRYCSLLGESLEFIAFDINGNPESDGGVSKHLVVFHKWHNDE